MTAFRLAQYNEQHYVFLDDATSQPVAPQVTSGLVNNANWVWDAGALNWVKETQPGGGGGGGACTIADGADVAEGATSDTAWAGGNGSVVSLLKALVAQYIPEFDYDGSGNVIYAGIAQPGTAIATAAWQIRKFTYDGAGNLLAGGYANGSRAFNQAWTGRAGLAYS